MTLARVQSAEDYRDYQADKGLHEADLANERVKGLSGQKPTLGKYHTELNPNQYGFAEQAGKIDPLDHDGDGKRGGSLPKSERGGKK